MEGGGDFAGSNSVWSPQENTKIQHNIACKQWFQEEKRTDFKLGKQHKVDDDDSSARWAVSVGAGGRTADRQPTYCLCRHWQMYHSHVG